MKRDEAMARIVQLLDELDNLKSERKAALSQHDEKSGRLALANTFDLRRDELLNDMLMCRQDARQMSLEEQDG